MALADDEQITFVTDSGTQYDVVRKRWGYYATPSLSHRLAGFNLHAVLAKNRLGKYFILLVERGCEASFEDYIGKEQMHIVSWLDSDEALSRVEEGLAAGRSK
jgi:hypothetical protein